MRVDEEPIQTKLDVYFFKKKKKIRTENRLIDSFLPDFRSARYYTLVASAQTGSVVGYLFVLFMPCFSFS